jgi:hypothetical protein
MHRRASGINPFIYCTLSILAGQLSQQAYILTLPRSASVISPFIYPITLQGVTYLSAAFIKIKKAILLCTDGPEV